MMRQLYMVLEDKYCYTYLLITEFDENPGGPIYYLNKYTNLKAQRQIEIVFHRNSTAIYLYLKRLVNNIEPAYSDNDNCFSFYEIDIYNGIDDYNRHSPYGPPDYEFRLIKVGLEILNMIPEVLNGSEWLNRERLNEIYLKQGKPYKSGHHESPFFAGIKKTFKFLESERGFIIIFDYDRLRPFEQHLGGALVYGNDKLSIVFSVDIRDRYFSLSIRNTIEYNDSILEDPGKMLCNGNIAENDLKDAKLKLIARLDHLTDK